MPSTGNQRTTSPCDPAGCVRFQADRLGRVCAALSTTAPYALHAWNMEYNGEHMRMYDRLELRLRKLGGRRQRPPPRDAATSGQRIYFDSPALEEYAVALQSPVEMRDVSIGAVQRSPVRP